MSSLFPGTIAIHEQIRGELRDRLSVTQVAILEASLHEHQYQVDKVAAFVSRRKLLLTTTLWPQQRDVVLAELRYRFTDKVQIIDMDEYFHVRVGEFVNVICCIYLQRDTTSTGGSSGGVCGLHTPLVMTTKNLYLPVFGGDEKVRKKIGPSIPLS
jgi:hypothetical protein